MVQGHMSLVPSIVQFMLTARSPSLPFPSTFPFSSPLSSRCLTVRSPRVDLPHNRLAPCSSFRAAYLFRSCLVLLKISGTMFWSFPDAGKGTTKPTAPTPTYFSVFLMRSFCHRIRTTGTSMTYESCSSRWGSLWLGFAFHFSVGLPFGGVSLDSCGCVLFGVSVGQRQCCRGRHRLSPGLIQTGGVSLDDGSPGMFLSEAVPCLESPLTMTHADTIAFSVQTCCPALLWQGCLACRHFILWSLDDCLSIFEFSNF